ncbi:hypothetical protein AVEN_66169-1, partial [Araneus ventricosus]
MLECEFRLVVTDPDAFQSLDIFDGIKHVYKVVYAKPHFRFKAGRWEVKRIIEQMILYHNGLWVRWVKSNEIPFRSWTLKTHSRFVDATGFFQNPFLIEYRKEINIDTQAKIFAFRKKKECGLVFEYESKNGILDVTPLNKYTSIFETLFRNKSVPKYILQPCIRKPVRPISAIKENCLVARKYDGIFGFVYSYSDHIYELWEDNVQRVRRGDSLGDGLVFSAEMIHDVTILLDVYQVRGLPTTCRQSILLDFLPQLQLPSGYRVQKYCKDVSELPHTPFKTDGLIFHDTLTDRIYKLKQTHTYDLVYW